MFIQKLVQENGKGKEIEEEINKQRCRSIEQGSIKVEPLKFEDRYGFEVSELEALALEMQGLRKERKN